MTDDQKAVEPEARMKKLVETSHEIPVNKDIPISKYFHSGREMIKTAAQHENKGEIEKAFVLYLRYMTLFLEKLIQHPQYKDADRTEKKLVKEECKRVFDKAEDLKKRIIEMYKDEYANQNK